LTLRRPAERGRHLALPDLAAARVWRDLFPAPEQVYTDGLRFLKERWAASAG
jgi:D-psicose/D-tagatose/L-ribulose 3-epimerase